MVVFNMIEKYLEFIFPGNGIYCSEFLNQLELDENTNQKTTLIGSCQKCSICTWPKYNILYVNIGSKKSQKARTACTQKLTSLKQLGLPRAQNLFYEAKTSPAPAYYSQIQTTI